MKIGDEVYVHGYVDEIRSDVVIIRNDGGYFGTVPSEVNCSEKPNNFDKDTNVRSKEPKTENPCDGCVCDDGKHLMYCMNCKGIARKTEPPKVEPLNQDLAKNEPTLVKDLVKAFCEDGTWLERQGVYTLTLAEAKQRAVDIIESVLAKTEPQTDPCDECIFVKGSGWCKKCNGKPKGLDALPKKDEPHHSGEVTEMVEPQTDIHGLTDCDFCKHNSEGWDSKACDSCCENNNHFEPKT